MRNLQPINTTYFDLSNYNSSWLEQPYITTELMHRYRILPLWHKENHFYIAIADINQHATIAALRFHTGMQIHALLVDKNQLDKLLQTYLNPLTSQIETTLAKITIADSHAIQDDPDDNDEPVIEFVTRMINDAKDKHISDIHIEPYETTCRIRFRRDGLLYEAATLPLSLSTRVIARLKLLANLNIAERRKPQDGRIHLSSENKIDIRINTCPTIFGEKMVLRFMSQKNIRLDLDLLGLDEIQKQLFLDKLSRPQGLILITGPTGSGKSTTIYSALQYLNKIEKNISSVEDPVEIELTGINQVNVNPKIGLDFAAVLRTFLRQDPDIIMIGEIRDRETAQIAFQAAETGHLVLATLHTNSAAETLTRLSSMGVATYHLTTISPLIIAQRLLRKLCKHCRQIQPLLNDKLKAYQAMGCNECHQGYNGRIGIFELLTLDTTSPTEQQHNLNALWQAGIQKVRAGETSYQELIRVLGHLHEKQN